MPMTRELKKRFMGIDDRIGKLEKKKPTQQTNGEDLAVQEVDASLIERVENIEAVLQIPGEKVGDTQVLSAWREIIENKLGEIETVLEIPGPSPYLSGFANKVDQVMTSLKERLLKLEQTPDPSATVLEFDDRLRKLEEWVKDRLLKKVDKVLIDIKELQEDSEDEHQTAEKRWTIIQNSTNRERIDRVERRINEVKDLEERVQHLEEIPEPASDVNSKLETQVRDLQTRDRMLTKEMNDNRPTLKKHEERLHNLEVKPVAGTLSQIAQDMNLSIEGNTREMKELKARNSLVHLLLLAVIILLFGISLLT